MKKNKYFEYIFKAHHTYFVGGVLGLYLVDKTISDIEKFVSAIERCSWARLYGIKVFTYDLDKYTEITQSKKYGTSCVEVNRGIRDTNNSDGVILHVERKKYPFDDTWNKETLKKGANPWDYLKEVCFAKSAGRNIFIPCPTEGENDEDCLVTMRYQKGVAYSQKLTQQLKHACHDIDMDMECLKFHIYQSRAHGQMRRYNTEDWEDAFQGFPQGDSLCESTLEELFYEAVKEIFPTIQLQYQIDAYRVDFAFQKEKIAIEVDGYYYHHTPEQLQKDSQKLRDFQKMGWRLLRFTEWEIVHNLSHCVEELRHFMNIPSLDEHEG